jgi:hypothetical protein
MSGDEVVAAYHRLCAQQVVRDAEAAQWRAAAAEFEGRAAQWQAENEHLREAVDDARALIDDLRRQVFGPKADRLTPEQEEQLKQILRDLKAAAARPRPASDEMLTEDEQRKTTPTDRCRRPRQPVPTHLETKTTVIEPADKTCPRCGSPGHKIGEEVTEELEFVPATLIRHRIVRPKYARRCQCETPGVTIAPLPPRLISQSTLGLGLAVHILPGELPSPSHQSGSVLGRCAPTPPNLEDHRDQLAAAGELDASGARYQRRALPALVPLFA